MGEPQDLRQSLERLTATIAAADARPLTGQTREQKRALRRQRRMDEATREWGGVQLGLATALGVGAGLWPQVWWLGVAAFVVAASGLRQFVLVSERERTRRTEGLRLDSRSGASADHEVDALCDQLHLALRSSPEVVRSFLTNPEETIEGLRTAAKAINAKRRLLQGADASVSTLERQRAELSRRREQASDPVAREKFASALDALAGNEAAVTHFRASRDRLDAEYASLLVLLQEMTTRVAIARTTDSGEQQLALAQSVQRLNAELEAITASLQEVTAAGPLEPLALPPTGAEVVRSKATKVS